MQASYAAPSAAACSAVYNAASSDAVLWMYFLRAESQASAHTWLWRK